MPRKRSLSYLRLLTADRHFLDQPLGWGDTQDILYSYNVEKLQSYNVYNAITLDCDAFLFWHILYLTILNVFLYMELSKGVAEWLYRHSRKGSLFG